MQTARFLIALSHHIHRDMRVERMMRKGTEERAVLYAQNWLHNNQAHEKYFGVCFTMYEVYRQSDDGSWKAVEIGDVSNAQKGRTSARTQGKEAKAGAMASDGQPDQSRKGGAKTTKSKTTRTRFEPTLSRRTQKRTANTLSPLQQRMQQLNDKARQTLAEKKVRGE